MGGSRRTSTIQSNDPETKSRRSSFGSSQLSEQLKLRSESVQSETQQVRRKSIHMPVGSLQALEQQNDLLKMENDVLQRKLKKMEAAVLVLETRTKTQNSELPNLLDVDALLSKAHAAKQEALTYKYSGRVEMEEELKQLYLLLRKAKSERETLLHSLHKKDVEFKEEKQATKELRDRFEMDREIFVKMINDDRDAFASKTISQTSALETLSEAHALVVVQLAKAEDSALHEIRKLTRSIVLLKKKSAIEITKNQDVLVQLRNYNSREEE